MANRIEHVQFNGNSQGHVKSFDSNHQWVLKNTFVEFLEPPKAAALCRAKTAPIYCCDSETDAGSITPRSEHTDSLSLGESWSEQSPSLPLKEPHCVEAPDITLPGVCMRNALNEESLPQQGSPHVTAPCTIWPATPTPTEMPSWGYMNNPFCLGAEHAQVSDQPQGLPDGIWQEMPEDLWQYSHFVEDEENRFQSVGILGNSQEMPDDLWQFTDSAEEQASGLQGKRQGNQISRSGRHHQGFASSAPETKLDTSAEQWKHDGVPPENEEQVVQQMLEEAQRKHKGWLWTFARQDKDSSKLVQLAVKVVAKAIAEAASDEAWLTAVAAADALLDAFRRHVPEAIRHPHANYVIQRIVECMPAQIAAFVPAALLGHGVEAAKHRLGCRTVIRIFRHQLDNTNQGANENASALAQEVLAQASGLLRDEFGNYVITELVKCDCLGFQQEVRVALSIDSSGSSHAALLSNAQTKHGSRVLEAALTSFSLEDSYELANDLLASVKSARALALSDYGWHVLKTIAQSGNYSENSLIQLKQVAVDLRSSKQGWWLTEMLHNSTARMGTW